MDDAREKKVNDMALLILDQTEGAFLPDDPEKMATLLVVFGRLLAATAHAANMTPETMKQLLQNLLMDYHENWHEEKAQ